MDKQDEIRRFKRELEVPLNEHELQQYGLMLSKEIKREDALVEKKKAINSDFAAQIAACRREQRRLAEAREKCVELRPVDCEEAWVAGTMQVKRLDTGAVVDVRPATYSESQLDIDDIPFDDDPEPVVMTPHGKLPPQDDGEPTSEETPRKKRGRGVDALLGEAAGGGNGAAKEPKGDKGKRRR